MYTRVSKKTPKAQKEYQISSTIKENPQKPQKKVTNTPTFVLGHDTIGEETDAPAMQRTGAISGQPHTLRVEKAKKPFVLPVNIKGYSNTPVNALIDSGAQSHFISQALAERIGLMEDAEVVPEVAIQVAIKDQLTMTSRAVQIPIEMKMRNEVQILVNVTAYVVEGIKDQIYLGLPFVKKYVNLIPWEQVEIQEETAEQTTEEQDPVELEQNTEEKDTEEQTTENLEEQTVLKPVEFINRQRFLREIKGGTNCVGLLHIRLGRADADEKPAASQKNRPQQSALEIQEVQTEETAMKQLLMKYRDIVTEEEPHQLPPKRFISHTITLIEGTQPAHRQQYRLSPAEKEELQKQVEDLLAKGFIKESNSPYNAPILFVKKKSGELRMCVDFRLLNLHTVKDRFPIPLIDDILNSLGGAKYFSKLDLRSGYHQVRIEPQDTYKTAFSTSHNHYEWLVMPFGLTNAPATFQRLMNNVLKDMVGKFVQVYLDDIIIYSTTKEEHLQHVAQVLDRLRTSQLVCKGSKCEFMKKDIKFLGFAVSDQGLAPDPDKIKAIKEWPELKTYKDAQRFLGLANFYRRFVPQYSKIAAPLTDFAAEKTPLQQAQKEAFEALKEALTTAPVLITPILKEGYTFIVTSDACGTALGYTLEQADPLGNVIGVVAYGSVKLSGAQLNYPVREKEFMAIISALKTWRDLLIYRKFVIQTDHHSLIYLQHQAQLNTGRLARWLDFLSQFDFTIKYLPGKKNSAADALSRRDDPATEINGIDLQEIDTDTDTDTTAWTQEINTELVNNIIQGYVKDPYFAPIYHALKTNTEAPKEIRHHATHYKLGDEYLLFSAGPGCPYRICIPQWDDLRTTLTANVHDTNTGAHFGALRCYDVLQRQFYWPRMFQTIHKYVQTCVACQTSKPSTQSPQGLLQPLPVPARRFAEVTMDFLTGIPCTERGYDMIFVIVDRLSKRVKLIPCTKSLTGAGAAELFLRHYFTNFGIPRKIISDKDVRFMGAFWNTLWAALGTQLLFTTTSHPQTDGQSERMMRIINQSLRALCRNTNLEWDQMLPAIEFAYNGTVHASTGKTPFEVDLGVNPDSPTFSSTWNVEKWNPYADDYVAKIKATIKQTQDQLVQAQRQQEKHHNRGRREVINFNVGDWVLLHKSVWGTRDYYSKTSPYYIGPYQVVKKLGPNAVEIALESRSKKQRTINVEWLKPFHARNTGHPKQPPRTELEAQKRIDEVASIVGYNEEEKKVTVNWAWCDPRHVTVIEEKYLNKLNPQRKEQLWTEAAPLMELLPEELRRLKDPSMSKKDVQDMISQREAAQEDA